jgi:cytochrome c5
MVPLLSACTTGTVELIDGKPVMKHELDAIGFENCFACHAGGLHPVPEAYAEFPLELCSSPACHILIGTPTITTTTTPTPTTTTTTTTTTPTTPTTTTPTESPGPISYDNHYIYTDTSTCMLCHLGPGAILANPEDHADYANDSCFDAGCHEPSVKE